MYVGFDLGVRDGDDKGVGSDVVFDGSIHAHDCFSFPDGFRDGFRHGVLHHSQVHVSHLGDLFGC